jgi:hypothetical protein
MKKHFSISKPGSSGLFAIVFVSLMAFVPGGWTQYPFTPAPPAVIGPTLGANLRNAAAAPG